MADKKQDKPDKDPKKAEAKKASIAKTEVIQSLKVEINFPVITDLKQAIGFDAGDNLVMTIQYKVKVDQFETFRLLNLLKQPHAPLYATLGTAQSAMDFKFDKDGRVEIVKAQIAAEKAKEKTKALAEGKPADKGAAKELEVAVAPVKIQAVTFNHIPEDERPYSCLIEYVNGTGELKTVAGRGLNPTEAVISGVHAAGIVPADVAEPFEIRQAIEKLEVSPENYKLIRVLDVGSFDEEKPKGD